MYVYIYICIYVRLPGPPDEAGRDVHQQCAGPRHRAGLLRGSLEGLPERPRSLSTSHRQPLEDVFEHYEPNGAKLPQISNQLPTRNVQLWTRAASTPQQHGTCVTSTLACLVAPFVASRAFGPKCWLPGDRHQFSFRPLVAPRICMNLYSSDRLPFQLGRLLPPGIFTSTTFS